MTNLLDEVLHAHGGLENWNRIEKIAVDISVFGATWAKKGWADSLVATTVEARRDKPWSTFNNFSRPDWISVWEPDRVQVRNIDGSLVSEGLNQRATFVGHTIETPWDVNQFAYFTGYAMWNYLVSPFLFTWPGFSTEEVGETRYMGDRRRKLKVVAPDDFPTHCKEQVFHVDDDGLIRRIDYEAWVAGNAPTAHFIDDYKRVDGLAFWTKRRAVRRMPDGTPRPEVVVVGIDALDYRLS